jgi:hypothetical protein
MTNEDKLKRIEELSNELSGLYQEVFEDIAKDYEGYERAIDTLKVMNYDLEEENKKQKEILEIFKSHFKKATFSDAFKVIEGERRFDYIKREGYYTMNHISLVFDEEEKNKIERWLENENL